MLISIKVNESLKNLPQPIAQKFLVDFEEKIVTFFNAELAKGKRLAVVVNSQKCDISHLSHFDGFEYALSKITRQYSSVLKQALYIHWDEVADYYWDDEELYCSTYGTLENVPRGFLDKEIVLSFRQTMGKLEMTVEEVC